mgnify:CR=1 FL=1
MRISASELYRIGTSQGRSVEHLSLAETPTVVHAETRSLVSPRASRSIGFTDRHAQDRGERSRATEHPRDLLAG